MRLLSSRYIDGESECERKKGEGSTCEQLKCEHCVCVCGKCWNVLNSFRTQQLSNKIYRHWKEESHSHLNLASSNPRCVHEIQPDRETLILIHHRVWITMCHCWRWQRNDSWMCTPHLPFSTCNFRWFFVFHLLHLHSFDFELTKNDRKKRAAQCCNKIRSEILNLRFKGETGCKCKTNQLSNPPFDCT